MGETLARRQTGKSEMTPTACASEKKKIRCKSSLPARAGEFHVRGRCARCPGPFCSIRKEPVRREVSQPTPIERPRTAATKTRRADATEKKFLEFLPKHSGKSNRASLYTLLCAIIKGRRSAGGPPKKGRPRQFRRFPANLRRGAGQVPCLWRTFLSSRCQRAPLRPSRVGVPSVSVLLRRSTFFLCFFSLSFFFCSAVASPRCSSRNHFCQVFFRR